MELRGVAILASLLFAGAAASDELDVTHSYCRADDPKPCILGMPVGMLEACTSAADAELWPFIRIEAVIDYSFEDSVSWWVTYGLRDMLQAHGLPELEGAVRHYFHDGRMEGWGPDDLAARGWAEGNRITFLVTLKERDTDLPNVLPIVRLPVFCRAWAERIGVGPDAAVFAGVWLTNEPGNAPEIGNDGTLSACPAKQYLFVGEDGATVDPGPDFPGVIFFDGAGGWFRSFGRHHPSPGSAALSILGPDPANSHRYSEDRVILLGTYEWDPPMLATVNSSGRVERFVVTELTPGRLATRRLQGPDFTFKTRSLVRCDPGMTLEALAELFRR